MLKKLIKNILSKANFYHKNDIFKNHIFRKPDYLDFLYGIIVSEISRRREFKIVQIGANDGVTRDPLNEIITNFSDRLKLLAIEPQTLTYERLQKNYSKLKNVYTSKSLVGDGSIYEFYSLNNKFAKYRNELDGISSIVKENLEKRIREAGIKDPENYYDVQNIKSQNLEEILIMFPDMDQPNMLQIDAEGFDDEIIYNSSIEKYNFQIINYEFKNLKIDRLKKLRTFLQNHNYKIFTWKKSDELAIKWE